MANVRLLSPTFCIYHEKTLMCINVVAESAAKWITVDVTVSAGLHLVYCVMYLIRFKKVITEVQGF